MLLVNADCMSRYSEWPAPFHPRFRCNATLYSLERVLLMVTELLYTGRSGLAPRRAGAQTIALPAVCCIGAELTPVIMCP